MILEVCDVSPRVHDSLGQTETLMTVNEAKEIRRDYSVFRSVLFGYLARDKT